MSKCTHEFWQREASVGGEGLCPLCMQDEIASLRTQVERTAKLIEQQANDPKCWVNLAIDGEYVQRQLRLLHAAFEGTDFFGIPLSRHEPTLK